ncbi:alpha/beta hydrolase family esterase [Dongia sp.]|uniref:alpha/beta hydrolase family esterase n=1 Tax=Dongia sp. TaxID=1977262 RepID=UPI003752978E
MSFGVQAEDSLRSITVDQTERRYVLHVPRSVKAPAALVIVLHGGGGSAKSAIDQTGFDAEADQRGFVVAYPEGTARSRFHTWNAGACCGVAVERGVDDVGFIRAMVAEIGATTPLDPKRIYATGLSNGGMMAYRLGCEASDLVAAIAPVSAVVMVAPCEPSFPVSVLHIHGTADRNVPIEGGVGAKSIVKIPYPPVERSVAFWAGYDDCRNDPIVSSPAPDVTLRSYPLCSLGIAVDYYVIQGGSHAWPGGKRLAKFLDEPSQAIAATPLIWRFFAAHPKP